MVPSKSFFPRFFLNRNSKAHDIWGLSEQLDRLQKRRRLNKNWSAKKGATCRQPYCAATVSRTVKVYPQWHWRVRSMNSSSTSSMQANIIVSPHFAQGGCCVALLGSIGACWVLAMEAALH